MVSWSKRKEMPMSCSNIWSDKMLKLLCVIVEHENVFFGWCIVLFGNFGVTHWEERDNFVFFLIHWGEN